MKFIITIICALIVIIGYILLELGLKIEYTSPNDILSQGVLNETRNIRITEL
jgi:hypothetical protein